MALRFDFPDPVNETSARTVAAGVVLMSGAVAVAGWHLVLVPLAYGFVARVASGPRYSPLGLLATKVVTPRLRVRHRFVPGPPKRFAQGIGATLSLAALVAWAAGAPTLSRVLAGMITVAAALEAVAAYCLGCTLFSLLIRAGIVPASVCDRCADLRLPETTRS